MSSFGWFQHLFCSWAEICQIFRWFFGKFKKIKKTLWNWLTFCTDCKLGTPLNVEVDGDNWAWFCEGAWSSKTRSLSSSLSWNAAWFFEDSSSKTWNWDNLLYYYVITYAIMTRRNGNRIHDAFRHVPSRGAGGAYAPPDFGPVLTAPPQIFRPWDMPAYRRYHDLSICFLWCCPL